MGEIKSGNRTNFERKKTDDNYDGGIKNDDITLWPTDNDTDNKPNDDNPDSGDGGGDDSDPTDGGDVRYKYDVKVDEYGRIVTGDGRNKKTMVIQSDEVARIIKEKEPERQYQYQQPMGKIKDGKSKKSSLKKGIDETVDIFFGFLGLSDGKSEKTQD